MRLTVDADRLLRDAIAAARAASGGAIILNWRGNTRVFVCPTPTYSRRDRLKALWWDRAGLAILAKRLKVNRYELPDARRHIVGDRRHPRSRAATHSALQG